MESVGLEGRPDLCKLNLDREVLNRRAAQIETYHKPKIQGSYHSTCNHRKSHSKNDIKEYTELLNIIIK